jgi:hypothetical protein
MSSACFLVIIGELPTLSNCPLTFTLVVLEASGGSISPHFSTSLHPSHAKKRKAVIHITGGTETVPHSDVTGMKEIALLSMTFARAEA